MTGKEFAKIRKELGLTQAELANVLAISTRAVQSYEQGWRKVVPAAERNILLLLMFSRQLNRKNVLPCWEMKKCPNKVKNDCIAAKMNLGNLCWYITGTLCSSECVGPWSKKIEKCRHCEVFHDMFKEKAQAAVKSKHKRKKSAKATAVQSAAGKSSSH